MIRAVSTRRGTRVLSGVFLLGCGVLLAAAEPHDASLRWFRQGEPSVAARALLHDIANAERRGLRSEDYAATTLLAAADLGSSPAVDAAISALALRFQRHLTTGRVSPRSAGYALDVVRESPDPESVLARLAGSPDPGAVLDAMEPTYHHYTLLRLALGRYRDLAARDRPLLLPPLQRSLRIGERWEGLPAVAERLVFLGDLEPAVLPAVDTLDPAVEAALRRFQARHGLTPDGVLGRATLAALSVPMSMRVTQLELSLERVRWLPPPRPGEPFLLVNIPQFRLFAFSGPEDRETTMARMDVVVGQSFPERNTPVFIADMTHLILRPYWDVPMSIARREELPRLRKDPGYAARQGFELVRGQSDESPVVPLDDAGLAALERGEVRLRQRPGPRNALGRIKFMLPNRYNVYLHDTPSRNLFGKARRAYSHGCIRIGDPLELARFVLADQPEWTEARLDEQMAGEGFPQRIRLTRPLRVMLIYATAVAAEDGRVLFFEDIYGHDARLARLLRDPASRL